MKTAIALLGLFGCLSAQTTLAGYVWGETNWHKVYITDGLQPFPTNHGTFRMVTGIYRTMADGSAGYITLTRQEWGAMANTLAHEVCHAIQDDRNIKQNEQECR